ncbi:hypothetical protein MMC19_005968 [Ptychographa xylographoides]|nr:hypothetical protein [Ptychographa xylographoides]
MSWRTEYEAAMLARDNQEQANKEVYDAYTQLADRTAILGNRSSDRAEAAKGDAFDQTGSPLSGPADYPASNVRQNLLEAQRSRSELQARLTAVSAELDKLKLKSKTDMQRIHDLSREKTSLTLKLRDRDEELRGKAKLLTDVHDENLSLTIELNMAEAQNQRLQTENKELVDRWMAQKSQEADAMNTRSKFS